jgi:ABC-2 type transport system ATP-binding protein
MLGRYKKLWRVSLFMTLLEFKNVKKRFGKSVVLEDVSFRIRKGEIFGLVGKSGCGKSTLLNVVIGMMRATSGTVLFEEKNAWAKRGYLRKRTGFASQSNTLFLELTIKENAIFFGKLYGIRRKILKQKFKELLSLLSLTGFGDSLVKNLSGGMKKRANLLVSLIHSPKLLILDEPTVGLDSILRSALWKYIKKINQEGTTILVTSHLLDEIEENCDRIAIINEGKIASVASVQEYKKHYGKNKDLGKIFKEIVS